MRNWKLVAVAMAMLLALASCGSDDDDDSSATDPGDGQSSAADEGPAGDADSDADEEAAPSVDGTGATLTVDGTSYELTSGFECQVRPVNPKVIDFRASSDDGSTSIAGQFPVGFTITLDDQIYEPNAGNGMSTDTSESGDLIVATMTGSVESPDGSSTVEYEAVVACEDEEA